MKEFLTILLPEAIFVFLICDFISLKKKFEYNIGAFAVILIGSCSFNIVLAMAFNLIVIIFYLIYMKYDLKFVSKTLLFILLLYASFISTYIIVEFCLKHMSSTSALYSFEQIIIENRLISSTIVSLITYSIYQIFLKPYKKEGINLALYLLMYFCIPILTIIGLVTLQRMITYINISNAYLYGSILAIILFIMNLTFVRIMYDKIKTDKFNYELENINKKNKEQMMMYQRLKKSNDDMLYVLHDVKNHINILTSNDENEDYLNELYNKFGRLKKYCYTNDILNIFLEEQNEMCTGADIQCKFYVDRIDFSFVEDYDLIALLTPPFEFSLKEKSIQSIDLIITNHYDMIFIHFHITNKQYIQSKKLENYYLLLNHLIIKYQCSISFQNESNGIEVSLLLPMK